MKSRNRTDLATLNAVANQLVAIVKDLRTQTLNQLFDRQKGDAVIEQAEVQLLAIDLAPSGVSLC